MAVNETNGRECVTRVTARRTSVLEGLGLGLSRALIVWLSVDTELRWWLMAGCMLGGLAVAPLWSPVESLWLEGPVLVQERRGKAVRADLNQLASVKREWIPKKGDELVLTDASGRRVVIWMLSDTTEELRRVVGERAQVKYASTDLFDPKTKRLLFLD